MKTARTLIVLTSLALLAACGEEEPSAPQGQQTAQPSEQQEAPVPSSDGTVLIEEDFEADAGPFITGPVGVGSAQVSEGQLQVVIPGQTVFTGAPFDESAQILRIEAQIEMTANATAAATCEVANGVLYLFRIGPDPSAQIYRVTPDEGPVQLGAGESESLKIAGGIGLPPTVDFRAECLGQGEGLPTRLILYDCSECNQIAVDVTDPAGLGDITGVGLGGEFVSGTDATGSAGVHFDDVRVTRF
jgi:hypothetical protein